MEELMAKFGEVVENPYARLAEWKAATGKKVIGGLPLFTPEELIHAAGMLPVVLLEADEPITRGQSLIQEFFCAFARSNLDVALKGKLDFLDGIVVPDTCHTIRGMAGILKRNLPNTFHEFLALPAVLELPASRAFLIKELRRLRAGLAELAGREISDDALRKSIEVFNRNRALLRRVYDLRRAKPGALRARDAVTVVVSGMLMPKEEHSLLLEALIASLEQTEPPADGRVKLLVSGSLCEAPEADLLNLIEDVGAVVVDDDLYTGSRYFVTDARTDGDPLEALCDKYLGMVAPCPTRFNPNQDWAQYLMDMARRSGARGVINIIVKFCEPHCFYYPHLAQELGRAGMPEFLMETEHEFLALGQMKTRLQAFIETIR